MAVEVTYQPPAVNPIAQATAASAGVSVVGAEILLQASQPFVPVDTGELLESGEVTVEGSDALVSYHRLGADGFDVAIRVHEDMTANHPNGGGPKYLEAPLHADGPAILAAMIKRAQAGL